MKKALLILANGFEEIEALGTADVLRRLNVSVTLAGVGSGEICGAHDMVVRADTVLSDVAREDFDVVILPGGMPGAANLDGDTVVDAVLKKAAAGGNTVIAAICAAPFVLAKRGLLNGKKFTMYPGFEAELGGLTYTSNPAETDGRIVTGKGPGAVFDFAAAIAAALGLKNECEKLYQGMFIK
ncbi:MAG: DJ-1/PfpI family protein [Lentisphaerae bacterium]|nr:DJ-1/PfpI family protein [Lentisphaerota bacterium]